MMPPVYLEGEVVTGAILPDTNALSRDFSGLGAGLKIYVNGQPVIVDPTKRNIVSIIR